MLSGTAVSAQEAPTPTPLIIQVATVAPDTNSGSGDSGIVLATATWTPTTTGPVLLEALDIANVRSLPSTDESQLGTIRTGDVYNVTGRYENWYQFQYNPAPNGYGWVYGELVTITGDAAGIPNLNPYSGEATAASVLPTSDSAIIPPGTGGVIATAAGGDLSGSGIEAPSLPTFTYPPGVIRPQATDPAVSSTPEPQFSVTAATSDVPPILPILVLGGLGILGLAASSLRR